MRKMSPAEYKRFREEQARNRLANHREQVQEARQKAREDNAVLDTRNPGEEAGDETHWR